MATGVIGVVVGVIFGKVEGGIVVGNVVAEELFPGIVDDVDTGGTVVVVEGGVSFGGFNSGCIIVILVRYPYGAFCSNSDESTLSHKTLKSGCKSIC